MAAMPSRPRVLWLSDLAYPAAGRRYGDEDIWLTAQLRDRFAIALAHPTDATAHMDDVDVVVVRNSGPVLHHQTAWDAFCDTARGTDTAVHNPLTGRGDQTGKRYLVELTADGQPVIPTVDRAADLDRLPTTDRYVVKPVLGADSIGLRIVGPDELAAAMADGGVLAQPMIDFRYEVSFTVVDGELLYALHAPDPAKRWVLTPYQPTATDRAFVDDFVAWNTLPLGIQRVDACRTQDGGLLLVELEDLNPYLSLDLLDAATRDRFVQAFAASIHAVLDG